MKMSSKSTLYQIRNSANLPFSKSSLQQICLPEVQIYWSADLLECRFAKTQLRKACMCNSSNLLISHLEMAHSHLATFTHWPTDPWAFFRAVSILESCEHFPKPWAYIRVVSIFQSREHISELWAFSKAVSIYQSCEHFGELWAFWTVVSIFQSCEQFFRVVRVFLSCEHLQLSQAFARVVKLQRF